MTAFAVLSLYKFVPLADCAAIRARLLGLCRDLGVTGTVIVAAEGINGTIAGSRGSIDRIRAWFAADPRMAGMQANESIASEPPFLRLKILLREEIVALADPRAAPSRSAGIHVQAEEWNALIREPDVTLIDCRNAFEVAIGTFEGAIDPDTTSFGDFPAFVEARLDSARQRRVAMFCTGGVRCEKASSLLLEVGFEVVYQLRGGVLQYLERVSEAESRWRGECFVFDRRVALRHGLRRGLYRECHGCKTPVSAADQQSPRFEPDVSCPSCYPDLTLDRRSRLRERRKQMALAAARGERHLGAEFASASGTQ